MAKKGLDEDRLKFFKGMGEVETPTADKIEIDDIKSAMSESDKTELRLSDDDKSESKEMPSESDKTEFDKTESRVSDEDESESKVMSSESDKTESDKTESRLSDSDKRKSANKGRKQASKILFPRSRARSTIPKIRAKKVDESVLDQALSAASKSPKVSIYSPFVAAVIKCNELTTIGYKSSADSRELLEKALEQAYPDICEKVRRYMDNK